MYLFVILIVLAVSFGIALLSYAISVDQIDRYFKRLSYNSADTFAAFADPAFLEKLRSTAESDEYQALRDKAEEAEDESLIEAYLREKGLWDEYAAARDHLDTYLGHMEDIKYLYIVVIGDKDAKTDMYLLDDSDNPLYQTGYHEEREMELYGFDASQKIEPTISHGPWGWLCSAYTPVKADDGSIICHVGCDVDMNKVMSERNTYLICISCSAFGVTVLALLFAILFTRTVIVTPLRRLAIGARRFTPSKDATYEEAGVVEMELKSNDEISDIYEVIRSTQMETIDYLNDLSKMEQDIQRYLSSLTQAENDIRDKEEQLGQMSKEVNRDALTHAGSIIAYNKKSEELSASIAEGNAAFAIVMVDLNDLKKINDLYGHQAGDVYIKKCCTIICDTFRHSPVYRIGGDEFVIVLQEEDYRNRRQLTEKLKATFAVSVANISVPIDQRYSAAVGMAEYASDDNTVELVFKRADKAMYADKMKYKKKNGSYR